MVGVHRRHQEEKEENKEDLAANKEKVTDVKHQRTNLYFGIALEDNVVVTQ